MITGKTKITISFIILSIMMVVSCIIKYDKDEKDTFSTGDTSSIDKWAWTVPIESNPLLTIQDIDLIPIDSSATTLLSENKTTSVEKLIKLEHKILMLKYINEHGLQLKRLHIGSPEKGVINAIGLYIDGTLWQSFRTYSAGGIKRSGITRMHPPFNKDALDSFFVANFSFTQKMVNAGLHGRINIGIEIYPRDSILDIFQVDLFKDTLGLRKEIKRVLNLTGKWSPSYDSLTRTLNKDEMIYPFPIQHPDSARLEPYSPTR